MNKSLVKSQKQFFANNTKIKTLEDAFQYVDVFLGLSKGGIVSKENGRFNAQISYCICAS